jgi:hypothetical protein
MRGIIRTEHGAHIALRATAVNYGRPIARPGNGAPATHPLDSVVLLLSLVVLNAIIWSI